MKELFDVYDDGKQIGVLIRENAYRWERLPIAYRSSIENTYSLARLTCEVLRSFYNSGIKFPECLEQFVEEESRFAKDREEYLTNLRLFIQHGGCETCGQCRFLPKNGMCKGKLPGYRALPDDCACLCGIRKENSHE